MRSEIRSGGAWLGDWSWNSKTRMCSSPVLAIWQEPGMGLGYHQRDVVLLLWTGFEFWILLEFVWNLLGKCDGWSSWAALFGVTYKLLASRYKVHCDSHRPREHSQGQRVHALLPLREGSLYTSGKHWPHYFLVIFPRLKTHSWVCDWKEGLCSCPPLFAQIPPSTQEMPCLTWISINYFSFIQVLSVYP